MEMQFTYFQHEVRRWLLQCFGAEIAEDTQERNHRFLEEALELVQSCGCSAEHAHQLVDYVFGRPVGEKGQEVGGVMVTLAALCVAQGLGLSYESAKELRRIHGANVMEQIRAKQATKPKFSPLPSRSDPALDEAWVAGLLNGGGACDPAEDDN